MKNAGWYFGGALAVGGVLFMTMRGMEKELEATPPDPETVKAEEQVDSAFERMKEARPEQVVQASFSEILPKQAEAEDSVSAPVKSLLLQDGQEHNYPSLLAEINKLGCALHEDEVAALMELLAWPNDRFPEGMRAIEINAVKNDVLDTLLRQDELPDGIGLAMAAMAADVNQDEVWRDYCVQFMGPFYERAASERTTEDTENTEETSEYIAVADQDDTEVIAPDELAVIQEAMFGALDERGSTIAGTALIGLENLSRTYEEFDRNLIVLKASEIAADETASSSSRLTALRLSAGLTTEDTENTETAEVARSLAQTGETVLLRSAALVTLGEVGAASDRELIVSYLSDDNRQLASAAQMALDKMDARL